jgi:hypothetical protein
MKNVLKIVPIVLILLLSSTGFYASLIQASQPTTQIRFYGQYAPYVASVVAQTVPNSAVSVESTASNFDFKAIINGATNGR